MKRIWGWLYLEKCFVFTKWAREQRTGTYDRIVRDNSLLWFLWNYYLCSQTISMKNLNGKQNLDLRRTSVASSWNSIVRPIQFTRTILDYFVFLSCASCVPSAVTLWTCLKWVTHWDSASLNFIFFFLFFVLLFSINI